ncbi:MAG: HAD family phosphatase [Candidatus Woesearchaeota archaeon]
MKLICFDLDGTIFEPADFWNELHKKYGTSEDNKILVKKYLKNNFAKLVEEVVEKRWKGKDAKPYYNLIKEIKYLPGAKKLFEKIKTDGFVTAVISGSSIELARRAQHDLGIDHIYANELVIKDNKVSGEFIWPVGPGYDKKVEVIEHLCEDLGIDLTEVMYIGNGSNDLEIFKVVGKSIAFNSTNEELKKASTHIVEGNDLRDVIKYI